VSGGRGERQRRIEESARAAAALDSHAIVELTVIVTVKPTIAGELCAAAARTLSSLRR